MSLKHNSNTPHDLFPTDQRSDANAPDLGLLDAMPISLAIYDRDGVLVHANAHFGRIVSCQALPSRDKSHPARWQGFTADGAELAIADYPCERALRGENVSPGVDLLHVGADEKPRWLSVSAAPIIDPRDQAIVGVVLLFLEKQDIVPASTLAARADRHFNLYTVGSGAIASIGRAEKMKRFASLADLLEVGSFLASGCVIIDAATTVDFETHLARTLACHARALPIVIIGYAATPIATAIAAMRAGAADYLIPPVAEDALNEALLRAAARLPKTERAEATAEVDPLVRLSPREREVLVGLIYGGTNKSIGRDLGISPRTVELHRSHLMERMNVRTLAGLLQATQGLGL